METAETIMAEMQRRVKENEPVHPASWVEAALRVNMLKGDLDNSLADMEATMADYRALKVSEGEPDAKAKTLSIRAVEYKKYLYLKAELRRIDEFIKLAKRRAVISEL